MTRATLLSAIRVHVWSGLVAGPLVLVLALSGAALPFAPEIDAAPPPRGARPPRPLARLPPRPRPGPAAAGAAAPALARAADPIAARVAPRRSGGRGDR